MIVKVVPHGDSFQVRIQQGVQSFDLAYEGTRKDCLFMAKMFRKALIAHDAVVIEKYFKGDVK